MNNLTSHDMTVEQLPDAFFILAPVHTLCIAQADRGPQGSETPKIILPSFEQLGLCCFHKAWRRQGHHEGTVELGETAIEIRSCLLVGQQPGIRFSIEGI